MTDDRPHGDPGQDDDRPGAADSGQIPADAEPGPPLPGAHAKALGPADQARWSTMVERLRRFGEALRGDPVDKGALAASQAEVRAIDLDMVAVRDALHVPENAGAHAAALEDLLRHIPDGWGRWISCDAGWYDLICRTHERLKALDPTYVIHQVKEKFGALRYYCQPSNGDADEALGEAMAAVVGEAEEESQATCETCGQPGALRVRQYWYKTLCDACAAGGGWEVAGTR